MVLFTPRLVRITLSNVSVWDEGGYFCQLYTDDTHHQVATLTVIVPPDVPTVEVKTEAVEGGEVELVCLSPRSKPPATLRWMRNRREVPGVPPSVYLAFCLSVHPAERHRFHQTLPSLRETSQQDYGKTYSVSNTIRIPVERRDNGAPISCEAAHPALGTQKKVRHYRLDTIEDCNLSRAAGVWMSLPAGGIGFAPPKPPAPLPPPAQTIAHPPRNVQWSRVNDTLPDRAETAGPTLTMARLSQAHNGTYLCQAHNNYGRAADHYTLLVYAKETAYGTCQHLGGRHIPSQHALFRQNKLFNSHTQTQFSSQTNALFPDDSSPVCQWSSLISSLVEPSHTTP
ncbi:hypothetical protein JZ751_007426 [Albula glossodonta]|uniref:Ig-like domain-containing protein n=1 Tax=Albula glossodonta TaxID=121402 RepID=A0A8T2N3G7_9TELE|nr:hypothetical protein JZ751_007426 [Albula glossodonta]